MIKPSMDFVEAINRYNREEHRAKVKLAEKQREEATKRFPIEGWPKMTLDEFAVGLEGTPETFCWFMEFKSREIGGIGGGTAKKNVIYRHHKDGWIYPDGFDDERDAWEALRHEFVQAFDHARKGEWTSIDQLSLLTRCSSLRLKTLHVYFPEDVLAVFSRHHLGHFLSLLRGSFSKVKPNGSVRANRELLQILRSHAALQGWSTKELQLLLYWWSHPSKAPQAVKIAPGRDASQWDTCLTGGFICVGWDEVGDLNKFNSKEQFQQKFLESYNYKSISTGKRKANEVWKFGQLTPGDIVVANKGTSEVLAVGTVIEPGYEWRDDREEFKHIVSVDWDTQHAGNIRQQRDWAFTTVKDISSALLHEITVKSPRAVVEPIYQRIGEALDRKGQAILHGPPGTGKTYTARRFATWWLLQDEDTTDADVVLGDSECMKRYEEELSSVQTVRRVWWAVSDPRHWSWDELSAGQEVTLRNNGRGRHFPLVQRGDLVVGYQSEPARRVAAIARISGEVRRDRGDVHRVGLECIANLGNGVTYSEILADPVLSRSEPVRLRCQGTLFALSAYEAEYLLAWLSDRNPGIAAGIDHTTLEVGRLTRLTFHPSYTYEDFIEGFRPSDVGGEGLVLRLEDGIFKRVCRAAQADPNRRFLVLIDEINRSNVGKIFGELLTLLERDKRGLTVLLPQSKETFSIPPNVFVLGTMNTADRSIKLMDAALRRRFAFLELMPDIELLGGAVAGELALDRFLEELNRRIAQSEGREKQVGHAYLLEDGGVPVSHVDTFARHFREEILPLLQEYCYDDYSVLARFIGGLIVDVESQQIDLERLGDSEGLVKALAADLDAKAQPREE